MLKDLLQPIIPGMFLLPSDNGGRFPQSHCVVVRGDTETLIDTGCGINRLKQLKEYWSPERVIVSHSHPDHASGLWLFEGVRSHSPVQHSDKFFVLEKLAPRLVEPGPLEPQWIEFIKAATGARNARATDHFGDGHVFDLGRIKLEALHAPGHIDDNYVFFDHHNGVALAFDIDLTKFGPWYGHAESDPDGFSAAIEAVKRLDPKILVSSHKGAVTDDIQGRLDEYAAIIERRDSTILDLLSLHKNLVDLIDASPIYGGFPYAPAIMRFWEGQMILKHLQRMEKKGLVRREGDCWHKA